MPDSKQRLRRQILARRRALVDRAIRSRVILERIAGLPEFAEARTVLVYVDVRSEVQTRPVIPEWLAVGKTIAVPWCRDDERLGLFRLCSPDELTPGRFGIPEPTPELLVDPRRHVAPAEPDLLLLPGVAFDSRGGRLGHGRGYFDRLLAGARPDAMKVGLAFECQLVPEVPSERHDVQLDAIVTEERVYRT